MIIDLILDRKDGEQYNPKEFYNRVQQYEQHLYNNEVYPIASAMDMGTNEDVKRMLSNYIDSNNYNGSIKKYIQSVDWV